MDRCRLSKWELLHGDGPPKANWYIKGGAIHLCWPYTCDLINK